MWSSRELCRVIQELLFLLCRSRERWLYWVLVRFRLQVF